MNGLRHMQIKDHRILLQGISLLTVFLVLFLLSGCSIWHADLDPDYKSSRAERLCHPYGQCSQGTWVAVDEVTQEAAAANMECHEVVAQRYGNGEWEDSVAAGLEVGRCMEKKGFRLQQ